MLIGVVIGRDPLNTNLLAADHEALRLMLLLTMPREPDLLPKAEAFFHHQDLFNDRHD
jgi:hypothetical protein